MRTIKFRAWTRFDSGNWAMLDHDNLTHWELEALLDVDDEHFLTS